MAQSRAIRVPDEVEVAKDLAKHAFVMAGAFVVIFAIAIALDEGAKYAVRHQWIDAGSYIGLAMRVAAGALATIDVACLICVVGKRAWRLVMRS